MPIFSGHKGILAIYIYGKKQILENREYASFENHFLGTREHCQLFYNFYGTGYPLLPTVPPTEGAHLSVTERVTTLAGLLAAFNYISKIKSEYNCDM